MNTTLSKRRNTALHTLLPALLVAFVATFMASPPAEAASRLQTGLTATGSCSTGLATVRAKFFYNLRKFGPGKRTSDRMIIPKVMDVTITPKVQVNRTRTLGLEMRVDRFRTRVKTQTGSISKKTTFRINLRKVKPRRGQSYTLDTSQRFVWNTESCLMFFGIG